MLKFNRLAKTLLGVAFVGALSLTASAQVGSPNNVPNGGRWGRLGERLGVTDQQRQQIQQIFQSANLQNSADRQRVQQQLMQVLTPEQQAQLQQMHAQRGNQQNWRNNVNNQGNWNSGAGCNNGQQSYRSYNPAYDAPYMTQGSQSPIYQGAYNPYQRPYNTPYQNGVSAYPGNPASDAYVQQTYPVQTYPAPNYPVPTTYPTTTSYPGQVYAQPGSTVLNSQIPQMGIQVLGGLLNNINQPGQTLNPNTQVLGGLLNSALNNPGQLQGQDVGGQILGGFLNSGILNQILQRR